MIQQELFSFNNAYLKHVLLKRFLKPGIHATSIEGLHIFRQDTINTEVQNYIYPPLFSIILQGRKRSVFGSEECCYGENQSLIAGVDIPALTYITKASPQHPFLALALNLDKRLITEIAKKLPGDSHDDSISSKGLVVTDTDPVMLDAFARLVKLLDKPEDIPILTPLILREIHYWLLLGPLGKHLRRIYTFGTQRNQLGIAVNWLKANYQRTLHVEHLAEKVGMATSTFHRSFKQMTTLSPIQYQKNLRLHEARRLILGENVDAYRAAYEVGYESATQFNREYKRLFGEPPLRDKNKLKRKR